MAKRAKAVTLEIPDEEFNKPKRAAKPIADESESEFVGEVRNWLDGISTAKPIVDEAEEVEPDEAGDVLGVRGPVEVRGDEPLDLTQDFSLDDAEEQGWERADEVKEIAEQLITEYFPWILTANILVKYVFSHQMMKRKGTPVLGRLKIVSGVNARLAGHDEKFFVMVISRPAWDRMAQRHRIALVHHELCHCGYSVTKDDEVKICTRNHDLEEFTDIVRLYGAWASDVQEFLKQAVMTPLLDRLEEMEEMEEEKE